MDANSRFLKWHGIFTLKQEQRAELKGFLSGNDVFTLVLTGRSMNLEKHFSAVRLNSRRRRLVALFALIGSLEMLQTDTPAVKTVWSECDSGFVQSLSTLFF